MRIITIDRDQRDVIWAAVVADLTTIGDVYVALLDDDPGERFDLTIADHDLTRTIRRLYAVAQLARDQLLESVEDAVRSVRTHASVLKQLAQDPAADHAEA